MIIKFTFIYFIELVRVFLSSFLYIDRSCAFEFQKLLPLR